MSTYRKKPVQVDAWRWLYTPEQEPDPAWVTDAMFRWPEIGGISFEPEHEDGRRICIATLDAVAIALPGDWIVRGVQGELYPCKPDIFEQTYEPVDAVTALATLLDAARQIDARLDGHACLPACRVCGCTQNGACYPEACSWAEPGLCSRCAL